MSDLINGINERIACDQPNLNELSAIEAKRYSAAFLEAEQLLLHIWEMQNERMTDGEIRARMTRTERNTFIEFISGLSRSISTLNEFEDEGKVEKCEIDIERDELRDRINARIDEDGGEISPEMVREVTDRFNAERSDS